MSEMVSSPNTASNPDQEFRKQWPWQYVPACDDGLVLLRHFAEAHPGAYRFAFHQGFVDLRLPVYSNLPRWQAFVKHCSACEKCNTI